MSDLQHNEATALAAQYINSTQRHIFLTGKAGTGKTTFLRYIVQHTFKNAVVSAPTGIAAINAGGVTLHSLLQLPFGAFIPEEISLPEHLSVRINPPSSLRKSFRFRADKRRLIREMELLIIDEVSMLRADLLDCIDFRLRSLRRSDQPFGGVQILFIGDLMQLPPVVKDEEWKYLQRYYKSPFFFEARALYHNPPINVELQKIYRQSDQTFIQLLNRLRTNDQRAEDIQFLNQFHKKDIDRKGYINLTTHNYRADKINEEELASLPGDEIIYEAEIKGDYPEHLYPIPPQMKLKKGAQVMFIKNDPSGNGLFFNGKIGEVSRMKKYELLVTFEDGEEVDVEKYEWQHIRYVIDKETNQVEEEVLGSFLHYPLKLAWAVTIHKSQGLTFEKAILDVSQSFAPGQLYVALSRLTSLDGLILLSPLPEVPPQISKNLLDYVEGFEDLDELSQKIETDKVGFLKSFARQAFDFAPLEKRLYLHLLTFNKGENRSLKQQYQPWTQTLQADFKPLVKVGLGFIRQVHQLLDEGKKAQKLAIRCIKAQDYFEPLFVGFIRNIQAKLRELTGKKQVKSYREELKEIEEAFVHQLRQIAKFCLLAQESAKGRLPSKAMLAAWEGKHKLQQSPPKAKKVPTSEISFRLFQEGLSPQQIADRRNLTVGTIHQHLLKWVVQGKISIERLIEDKKAKNIQETLESNAEKSLTEIKAILGEDVSYEDLRYVRAWINKKNNSE